MKEVIKTSRLTGQLEGLFNKLNASFFDRKLDTPIITAHPSRKSYGHYTILPLWDVNGETRHEINIAAGTLDRPIEEIVGTLLHEMVHMYNYTILGIEDCSGSSRMYHNKTFKRTAETHGLICTRTRYGWSQTEPSDALLAWIIENDIPEIKLNRKKPQYEKNDGGCGHSHRYKCPCCGQIVRTTKVTHLICGYCNKRLVEIKC